MRKTDLTRQFVHVNRNLMHHTLARDRRVRQDWCASKKTGRWLCRLPGNDRILLLMPRATAPGERRCPNGFDVALLFLLLGAAHGNDGDANFPSEAAMLRAMGVRVETRYRLALRDAIDLWSALSVKFERCWHVPDTGKVPTHRLPPPIVGVRRERRLHFEIDPTWSDLGMRYFVQVPLPLPVHAPTQNLILQILTRHWSEHRAPELYRERLIFPVENSELRSKIGLGRRGARLELIIKAAARWFDDAGGSLTARPQGYSTAFSYEPPKLPKSTHRRNEDARVALRKDERREEAQDLANRTSRGVEEPEREVPERRHSLPFRERA